MPEEKNLFEVLNAINVSDKTEKKGNLTYLSWSWAWGEFKKIYPDAIYEVKLFQHVDKDGTVYELPYMYDKNTGYMVMTTVTAGDLTHEMWLPVMDGANKAMKDTSYTYMTKYGEKEVEQASMFDVNKTIMRCLVKNLAMFGLGLYIYSGEDLPETAEITPEEHIKNMKKINSLKKLVEYFNENQRSFNGNKEILNCLSEMKKKFLDEQEKKKKEMQAKMETKEEE